MSGSVTPARFHEFDWRVLAYAACTHFRTASLAEAVTLASAGGNVAAAARLLGVDRTTVARKLAR